MATRIAGFRGEFLWELEIAERQIVAIAECIPAERYDWRPVAQARSFSEVFVHVRLLAHTDEHMGQMIAYLRFNRIAPPWPDWRPDRRT
jgi:hypothetical protein